MMSQALKDTFSGFTKEQQRLAIPKGKALKQGITFSFCVFLSISLSLPLFLVLPLTLHVYF